MDRRPTPTDDGDARDGETEEKRWRGNAAQESSQILRHSNRTDTHVFVRVFCKGITLNYDILLFCSAGGSIRIKTV